MTEKQKLIVQCPNCKKYVSWTPKSLFKPFCSKRCRLADLNGWFDEVNRIAGDPVLTNIQEKDIDG